MAYLNIADFKYGMDRRRPRSTGIPGTLWTLKNAFISRGGDVVRAKKFVEKYMLPAGTIGLAQTKGQLYTFGDGLDPGLPFGVQYQQLVAPGFPTLTRILDVKSADGLLYVVAEFSNGAVHHFYDGVRVTDWDTIGGANSTFGSVAEALAIKISASTAVTAAAVGNSIKITALVAGTPFTCTATALDVDADASLPTAVRTANTANVVAVAAVRAHGTVTVTGGTHSANVNKITQVNLDGDPIINTVVNWTTSNSHTASLLAAAINNRTAVTTFSATVVGAVVTIRAPVVDEGAQHNGIVVSVVKAGNVTTSTSNFTGGVSKVTAVKQVDKVAINGSVFDDADKWSITVNGTTYDSLGQAGGVGRSVFVHKKRVYSTAKSLLRYTKLSTFTDWTTTTVPATDAGFINLSTDTDGSQDLIGCVRYNGMVAIFADNNVIIYTLDTDAENDEFQQTLENTGSKTGPQAILAYGNTDVFYLDDTGIRSIRSRDGYNAGYVSDVGSAIDDFVQATVAEAGADAVDRAQAVIEPSDGRYLLSIGDRILALSFFPTAKISAWSYIEPGFTIEQMVRADQKLWARSGDTIYLYGGDDGTTYPDADEQIVTLETPFMSANDPAGIKALTGGDIDCLNDWAMDILVDPNDETLMISAGSLSGFTYNKETMIGIPGYTSHIAYRMTCSAAGDARISSVALHFDKMGSS